MELLGVLLDVIDAVAGAIGFGVFWYTWVAPRSGRQSPRERSGQSGDVDQFVQKASEFRGPGGACA